MKGNPWRKISFVIWFRVDWSAGAQTINYARAVIRVSSAGEVLGKFIDFLHERSALRFEELTVVGFSLGG